MKIKIFSTKFGNYISHTLKYILSQNNIYSEIVYNIYPHENDETLYIILFSQKVKQFPKNYIIYQLEQKDISKWIDKKYEASILFSKFTLDYSQSNIIKFSNIIQNKMIYYPIPLIHYKLLYPSFTENNSPKNNILFYGSMNEIRKEKLIFLQKKLYPKYYIKILNNIYGDQLINEINNSKIVLNIHFYKNAILETCRINEILACNKIVISEKPDIIDIYNQKMYEDKVIFIDSISEMYEKIIYYLDNNLSFYNIFIQNENNNSINDINNNNFNNKLIELIKNIK
jgi:hypothetical protein